MRPLLCAAFILATGLVVGVFAPGGEATTSTPGDGCLVVANGNGTVTVKLTRGVVFGRFQEGDVTIDDLSTSDGPIPSVYAPGALVKLGDHRAEYTGSLIRFRTNGAVKIVVNAQSIALSVVGKGTAVLFAGDAAGKFIPRLSGTFSVDAASFCQDNLQQMPAASTRFQISSPVAG
jgi:hypothetical protein